MHDDMERLYDLLYLLPVGVVAFADDGTVDHVNPLTVQLLNPFVAPPAMSDAFALLAPLAPNLRTVIGASDTSRGVLSRERAMLQQTGAAPIWIELSIHRIRAAYYVGILANVTELVQQEHELRRERDRIRVIVEMVHDYAIYTTDRAGIIDSWNSSGERLFGLDSDRALGRSLGQIGVAEPAELGDLLDGAVFAGWRRVEGWSVRKSGEPFYADTMISTLVGDSGWPDGFAVITRDATEARRREEALLREADTDPLTGLANRRGFAARADRLVTACEINGAPAAVLMCDIDHFKRVNDTFGHDGGDAVLRVVGSTLHAGLRKLDLLGRLGGEEFAALLAGSTLDSALRAAESLRAEVEALVIEVRPGVHCRVTISIGAAPLRTTLAEALRAADLGLYAAKAQGRNRVLTAPEEQGG